MRIFQNKLGGTKNPLSARNIQFSNFEMKLSFFINVIHFKLYSLSISSLYLYFNILHPLKKYVLHVITRGKAGKISFLEKGNYATNTNAFIFYLKDNVIKDLDLDTEDKIKVYLKFLKIYLQNIFFEACSKSDVSVFPLTELMKGLLIPKIKFSEDIKKITDIYDNLENLLTECKDKLDKINLIYKKDFI